MIKNIMFIPNRLKELRKKDGTTQKEFGEKVGCTMASISAYENGSKIPPTPILIKIAEVCDCSIDWLFGLKDDPAAGNKEIPAKTYSDYIKKLFALDDNSISLWLEKIANTDTFTESECYDLAFSDSALNIFLKAWKKTRDLYHDGTIDATIYQAWKEKVLRDFDVLILNSNEQWHDFYDIYKDLRKIPYTEYDATIEALRLGLPRDFTADQL